MLKEGNKVRVCTIDCNRKGKIEKIYANGLSLVRFSDGGEKIVSLHALKKVR